MYYLYFLNLFHLVLHFCVESKYYILTYDVIMQSKPKSRNSFPLISLVFLFIYIVYNRSKNKNKNKNSL